MGADHAQPLKAIREAEALYKNTDNNQFPYRKSCLI